ncbi:DUF3906 family protein [Paenibacillus sp. SYP-B3998]|uniref:DUF3906 family protein n=1 Tax=Paenibacillus sp. SYP-B3998 TaxID=2678564 RepID=A0A6G4A371_9BACL|nr:DUF3906 family protein [Paenibacillus sp. SYP-B3998]NEW08738.1 DUF3906 family protein [Paenibacillus sp. SYP-B3998]
MFMYRMEIELQEQLAYFIVLSETDEKAFQYAEEHLERHFIAKPKVYQLTVLEKKRVHAGSGYVIETKTP